MRTKEEIQKELLKLRSELAIMDDMDEYWYIVGSIDTLKWMLKGTEV